VPTISETPVESTITARQELHRCPKGFTPARSLESSLRIRNGGAMVFRGFGKTNPIAMSGFPEPSPIA
jgi:hypothetical protein